MSEVSEKARNPQRLVLARVMCKKKVEVELNPRKMLVIAKGNCVKCGSEFGSMDTVQSVHVECDRCKTEKQLCEKCKAEGCVCGGNYLNVFDKYPNLMH